MPYYPKLLADVSEGLEPGFGDRGDQEGDGFLSSCFWMGVERMGWWVMRGGRETGGKRCHENRGDAH